MATSTTAEYPSGLTFTEAVRVCMLDSRLVATSDTGCAFWIGVCGEGGEGRYLSDAKVQWSDGRTYWEMTKNGPTLTPEAILGLWTIRSLGHVIWES